MNWPLVAAILAVLAVPFGIAAIQDIGRSGPVPTAPELSAVDEELPPEPDRDMALDLEGAAADEESRESSQVMEQGFFDRVLLTGGGGPGLHGALAGARFGMTRDQARIEAAALWRWAEQAVSEFPPALARLDFRERGGEGLSAIVIRFPDDGSAARALAASWGPPVEARGQDDETRSFWFDARTGTRAVLSRPPASDSAEVVLQRVQPIESLYRRGRGFAFETGPIILGATAAELAAAYGADFEIDPSSPSAARLVVDPSDYALDRTRCTIAFEEGKAVAIQVVIDHSGRADFGPAALDALRAQLGPVRDTSSDQDGSHWTFDDDIAVQQVAGSPQLVVSASRP